MPLITEPIEEVRKQIDEYTELNLTSGDITDVWFVVFIGILMYFFSKFIGKIIQVLGVILVILGLYTIFTAGV